MTRAKIWTFCQKHDEGKDLFIPSKTWRGQRSRHPLKNMTRAKIYTFSKKHDESKDLGIPSKTWRRQSSIQPPKNMTRAKFYTSPQKHDEGKDLTFAFNGTTGRDGYFSQYCNLHSLIHLVWYILYFWQQIPHKCIEYDTFWRKVNI